MLLLFLWGSTAGVEDTPKKKREMLRGGGEEKDCLAEQSYSGKLVSGGGEKNRLSESMDPTKNRHNGWDPRWCFEKGGE